MQQNIPPDRDSERRFATVLFADVAGFTAMSRRMDPEDVTGIMNRCFEILEQVVVEHGGHVDKYIGDCIMAVFGVPSALEHAPLRAVYAAIEMLRRLRDFNLRQGLESNLDLHVGINSGLVVAGEVGGATTHDFTVMGDTVNMAARLKDASPIGEIWVGPLTQRYTRDAFEYVTLPLVLHRPNDPPITAHRFVRAREGGGPADVDSLLTSTLVGRAAELATLRTRLVEVGRGNGGIVSVVGEAGLGKSRLILESMRLEEARGLAWMKGGCLAIGRQLPFHPFVDLLRQWAGVAASDGEQRATARIADAVRAVAPEHVEELVPFLVTVMGLHSSESGGVRLDDIEGEARQKLVTRAVRDLFEAIARLRPLVVVLEDLHWADRSSTYLLESLLSLASEAPVLFVLALRPDFDGPARVFLELVRNRHAAVHTELMLAPLSLKEGDHLARNLTGLYELPYATLGPFLHKAEGNPFFIEEVLRSLIEEGALQQRDGEFLLTERVRSAVIPGTIQEVILGRIDRLPAPSRRVLQVASVIGRIFHHDVLSAIVEDADVLAAALDDLQKRRLIVERIVSGEREYLFQHALGQEALYESLLQRTRKDLHLSVARTIEALFASRLPEFYGRLAYHYSRAEHLEKAEDYLFRAGDEAARAAASHEALEFFREASRLYLQLHGERADPAKKALLEKNIGVALLNQGNLTESVPHFNKALEHLGERVPRGRLGITARFASDLAAVLWSLYVRPHRTRTRGMPELDREAMEIRYHRAKAQTTTDTTRFFFDSIGSVRRLNQSDPASVGSACGMYAASAALFGFSGLSTGVATRMLAVARSLARDGNIRDQVTYRSMQFIHCYLVGDWSDEHRLDPALVEQGLRRGLLWEVSTYLGLCTDSLVRRGQFVQARAHIEQLARIAATYGSDFAKSNEDGNRALLLIEERALDAARVALDCYYVSRVEKLFNLLALGWQAKLRLLAADHEGAGASLEEAERVLAGLGRVPVYHRAPYVTARFAYDVAVLADVIASGDRHRLAAARRRCRGSRRTAGRLAGHVAAERPELHRINGRLLWLLGKRRRALDVWQHGIAEATRLGMRPELGRTHADVAFFVGQGEAAERARAEARTIFTEVGLPWDLRRLDAATT
jgi:class 3 adenylate cyclase/tetratricopeptide (TPR) repeat protein